MGKYLDPRADLTFKKVFADHKDLMIIFLNALLPLPEDGQVTDIEYLPFELIPSMPLKKDTLSTCVARTSKNGSLSLRCR